MKRKLPGWLKAAVLMALGVAVIFVLIAIGAQLTQMM